jgi:CO dehydrogenase maturation factor
MAFTIAIAGKGGTGKTTIAAMFLNSIVANKLGSCLAIDADPNSNLADLLGIKSTVSVGALIDSIAKKPDLVPTGMSKAEFIELEIQKAVSEDAKFDLLAMGRPEGPGCYCYANNCLRDVVFKLINQYAFCIIDNEAGMEHLSRRTMRKADFFIVISDTTRVGMQSALRIRCLIDELEFKFKNIFLFLNKVRGRITLIPELANAKFDAVWNLPFDQEVLNLSVKGKPIINIKNSKLLKNIEEFRSKHGFRAS